MESIQRYYTRRCNEYGRDLGVQPGTVNTERTTECFGEPQRQSEVLPVAV